MSHHFSTATGGLAHRTLPPGGASPSLPTDKQRTTGALSTVRGVHYWPPFPERIRRIEIAASSGPAGVEPPSPGMRTKRGGHPMGASVAVQFFSVTGAGGDTARTLHWSGVSPFKLKDTQRLTGRISTVRAMTPVGRSRIETGGLEQPTGVGPLELIRPVPGYERRSRAVFPRPVADQGVWTNSRTARIE